MAEESSGNLTARKILSSITAVIAGSVTIVITTFGVDAIMRWTVPAIFETGSSDGNQWILLFILLYGVVFSALGGYVTAWLGNRSPMKHAVGLGILQSLGAVAVVTQAGDALPRWYAVTALMFPLPAILLGGYLRARKTPS